MGNNYPCPECCGVGTAVCECECRHCLDNQAACCYIVQVEFLADQDCLDCDDLNRRYFLLQTSGGELGTGTGTGTDCNALTDDTGTGTGTCGVCTWTYRVTEQATCEETELCEIENTLLTVKLTEEGEYVFTFTLGDMQWEWVASGTAAIRPECCAESERHVFGQDTPRNPVNYGQVMTLVTSGSQCDEESAVVTLSWTEADKCSFTPAICSDRLTGVWPCCIQVEISGTPAFDAGLDASSCLNCDCYDGTVVNVESHIGLGGVCDIGCGWNTFSGPSDPPSEICRHWDIEICLLEVGTGSTGTGPDASGADYAIEVTKLYLPGAGGGSDVIFKKFYEDPPEVSTFVDEEIPYFSGGDPDTQECFWAGTGAGTFADAPSVLLTGIVGGVGHDCITGDFFGECRHCHCRPLPLPDIKVTLSGVIPGCASCSGVDGTYVLVNDPDDPEACRWEVLIGVNCGVSNPLLLRLELEQNITTRATEANIQLWGTSPSNLQIRWEGAITDPFRALECGDFGPIDVPLDTDLGGCDSDGTAAVIESV